jgi:hypothetical protein
VIFPVIEEVENSGAINTPKSERLKLAEDVLGGLLRLRAALLASVHFVRRQGV